MHLPELSDHTVGVIFAAVLAVLNLRRSMRNGRRIRYIQQMMNNTPANTHPKMPNRPRWPH
jgi:hypothetical protein